MSIYAQKARYYMHIPNKQDVPVATMSLGIGEHKVILQSVNENLSKAINNYNVTEFRQAFPNAVTDWLREVYYVECDSINTNSKTSLSKTVLSQFKENIPLIEELGEPISTEGGIYTPIDPQYNSNAGHRANLELIRAPEAWEITRRYPKIEVAVHDTYFQNNEDLIYTNVIQNVQQGGNNVHGGFVAGCLGATNNNNKGIASLGGFNTNLVVSTKNWCSDNGVLELARAGYKVINCSWINSLTYSSIVNAVYKEIRDIHNTVVVFGAGNGQKHGGATTKTYPASYEYVLSVTSVGHYNNIGHSNNKNWKDVHEWIIGDELSSHHHNDAIDICAPGYDVLSTMGSDYSESDGTSFAAPQVAAAAALIRVVNPALTAKQVIDILKSTADASIYNIPQNSKYIGKLGTGRLDAYEAVKKACSVDLASKTFSNETYSGCIIGIKNSTIPANKTLTLNVTKEVNFDGTFSIATGGTLNVIYSGIPL